MTTAISGNLDVCDERVAEGCIAGGGRWVTFRQADGTFETINAATGDPVAPEDVLSECPPDLEQTTFDTISGGETLTFPGAGATLTYWRIQARTAGVTITINGVQTGIDPDEVVESQALAGNVLNDTVTIVTDTNEAARVTYRNLV